MWKTLRVEIRANKLEKAKQIINNEFKTRFWATRKQVNCLDFSAVGNLSIESISV